MFAFHECEGGLDFNLIGLCCFVNIVPDAGRKCRLSTPERDAHAHTHRYNRGTILLHTQTHGKLNNQLSSMLLLLSSVLSAALCSTALLTRHHFKQFGHFNIFTLGKCFVICLSLSPSVSFKSLFFFGLLSFSLLVSLILCVQPTCLLSDPVLHRVLRCHLGSGGKISTSSWRLSTTWR